MMNMKRLLSLILAFVMVLGMFPVPAFANEREEVPSVDVVLSLSADDCFMVGPGSGAIMAMKEISVPYFDLALYGLEEYYFVSESYGDDGDGLPGSDLEPGTPEYAYGKVTLLHLYIYALEVFYCGIDPDEAGQGYLYNEGLIGTEVFSISGSVGSSFLNQFWGGDCNLNYYVNYEYPLASEGWGATSDQILLREGDIITLGHFTGWSFYADPYSIFNYITADKVNPVKGEEVTLTLYYAGANMGNTDGTAQNLNTYCLDVYYAPVNDIPSEYVTDWEYIGTADENGQLVVDTSVLEAGEYIFAVAGQYGVDYSDEICSTPGGVRVSVEEAVEEPVTKYGIDVSGSNGTVEADKAEAAAGETVTLTVTPNDGYEFGSFWVLETENYDEVSIEFTELGNNQYSFVMPAYGLDITGIFVLGAASVDDAGFVIKVNDVEMELVDGGSEACTSRYVSNLFRIINVTVPYGTTTVTVERTSDENSPNIQYMNGTSHTFGGNAMPTFEADVVNYDGLCISCGGKYYHVTFEFSKELPRTQIYKEASVVGDGEMIVAYQGIVEDVLGDYDLPYHHVGLTSGTLAFQFTYDAVDAQPMDMGGYYEFYMTPVLLDDPSYEQDMFYVTAEDNGDGTWNAVIDFMMLPQHITNYFSQNPGTGYAFVLWSGVEQIPVEMFSIEYGVTPGNRQVYVPFENGFTFTGAEEVAYGADYTFTVEISNGYLAGEDFAIIINGETYATEPGTYTVENVTENLIIEVEGIEVIRTEEVTFYFSVEEGNHFVEQGGVIWALEEVTVPYFDLAAYGMEYLYYNPDCYSEGQASQAPGTKEQAEGVVTMLHALIWLTEVYYNELDPDDAGQGWLYENGWPGFSVYSATAGSAFFTMWDFSYNFNYYVNYEYPLGYPGWGATCDQIKLSDGDVVSMRYNDNSGNVGTYHHFGAKALVTKTVNKGQSFDLDIYRTGEDYANYTTPVYLVGEGHNVYLFAKDAMETMPASGTLIGTTDANGKVTIDTSDLELGTYYLVSNSTSPAVMLLTIEGGDHIHEYDAVVTDPTCTERGYTTYTCECGDSYVSDYVDPTGHNFVDGECANGCGTTATVIPEEALFTDITCDVPGVITVTYEGIRDWYPYFHVVLPADATKAYVTFPADSVQGNDGYAWVRGIDFTGETWATDYSPTYTVNEDGTWTIELSINNFYAEEAWQGIAACFWKDGSVNQAISFCNAAGEGGEEPVEPEYKSEYGITVMVGDEELDLVDNGTETCGVMQAQKLTVTVPAGTTEVTFLNITDTVVYGQMYIYSGTHDWTEYASNVTEATINLDECGTSFCISDSANNWYHVTIVVEEPEPSYKSGYGITIMVGDEEMDLVDNGTETCGVMQAQKLNVTVPAGTTEVTFLNITDEVLWGQMYIYSGTHDWTEYASNVIEATINLEECGNSFCISDSANNWYHVTIVVEEPPHEHSYEAVVTAPTCTEGGYTTYTCSCGDSYIADETAALGHTKEVLPAVAATCTETGLTEGKKCSVCGEITVAQEVVDALGHTEEIIPAVAPTCTATGLTEGKKCTVCGEITVAQEVVDALGHTEEIIPAVAPTCTATGLTEGKKCTVCGETLVAQEVIPALGHDFVNGECSRCDATSESSFEDVKAGDFFFDPVEWAVEEGITTGATETTFNPDGDLLRAQVVTMLWRHAGEPKPTTTENPFTDVDEDDWYYNAVLWAVEKGITNGTSATTFNPMGKTNRAQAITFLWRYLDEPEASAENPFVDVNTGDWYGKAVLWAVANGITEGMSQTQFGINVYCNRAHMVTFMYRAMA